MKQVSPRSMKIGIEARDFQLKKYPIAVQAEGQGARWSLSEAEVEQGEEEKHYYLIKLDNLFSGSLLGDGDWVFDSATPLATTGGTPRKAVATQHSALSTQHFQAR